jgi:predicted GIY-YIG superfamily endonuclease
MKEKEMNNVQPLYLDIVTPSDHVCYIIRSVNYNKIYIGYTINFPHRLRQHNGEIAGGAKKTIKWRPWYAICVIKGFAEHTSALRFEYRLQHPGHRRTSKQDIILFVLQTLHALIRSGDGSVEKNNKISWPHLTIDWHVQGYQITEPRVYNNYYHCHGGL